MALRARQALADVTIGGHAGLYLSERDELVAWLGLNAVHTGPRARVEVGYRYVAPHRGLRPFLQARGGATIARTGGPRGGVGGGVMVPMAGDGTLVFGVGVDAQYTSKGSVISVPITVAFEALPFRVQLGP